MRIYHIIAKRKEANQVKQICFNKKNRTAWIVLAVVILILAFAFQSRAEQQKQQQEQSKTLNILPTLINANCRMFLDMPSQNKRVLILNESFYNKDAFNGPTTSGATSCKGATCWSWEINRTTGDFRIYTADLPLSLKMTETALKSVSQTVKQTTTLRKSASDLISAAKEAVAQYSTSKETTTTKERSITEQKSQSQSIEQNLNPQFLSFVTKGLAGTLYKYSFMKFCTASAVDLVYKAYETDRLPGLVSAFLIYKSVKPTDISFSADETELAVAKYIYSFLTYPINTEPQTQDYAWAQSVLLAHLLMNWPEFAEYKTKLLAEMKQDYERYKLLKANTTQELISQNKDLATVKYILDKRLTTTYPAEQLKNEQVEDVYAFAVHVNSITQEERQQFENALKSNDPLLTKKLIKPEPAKTLKKVLPVVTILTLIALIIVAVVFVRKRNKNRKEE